MKAYFTNLPTKTWLLLVVPALLIAYPVARVVVPEVVTRSCQKSCERC